MCANAEPNARGPCADANRARQRTGPATRAQGRQDASHPRPWWDEQAGRVRLPDDVVEFVDALVRDGKAKSRAAVVRRALERERRRAIAARDAAILARSDADADMDELTRHVAGIALDLK